MSTITDNVKPAEEFVVFTDDSSTTPREDKTNATPPTKNQTSTSTSDSLSLDNTAPPPSITRIDSFPKTLPLPASSILSPVSAAREHDLLPSLSEQQTPPLDDIVSPPERSLEDMLAQTAPLPHTDHTGTVTPLAELAGTAFDQQVALRRRGDSILGEEISEGVSKLDVEGETTPLAKEINLPPREVFSAEELAARKNNPAVVSALPQTPSAEDFEVAKIQTGANFTPEFTETKVAS
ncbi:hypothetical protein TWF506_002270 [Arthrobotrys conoides]|uniref:Uncharacterized protein n=1 Tax=Arthrobotrys conoides TaxID=74498 RepID=A0AAN8RJN2_9PEZI